MHLDQWLQRQGNGAITRLQLSTGLSYTAIHRAARRKSAPTYETAVKIAACTNGQVSVAEICKPRTPQTKSSNPAPKGGRKRASKARNTPKASKPKKSAKAPAKAAHAPAKAAAKRSPRAKPKPRVARKPRVRARRPSVDRVTYANDALDAVSDGATWTDNGPTLPLEHHLDELDSAFPAPSQPPPPAPELEPLEQPPVDDDEPSASALEHAQAQAL